MFSRNLVTKVERKLPVVQQKLRDFYHKFVDYDDQPTVFV